MTGRNPDGAEDFPSEAAYGPQRLNTAIGAYEDFLDRARGTDDLSFHFAGPARRRNPPARRHPGRTRATQLIHPRRIG